MRHVCPGWCLSNHHRTLMKTVGHGCSAYQERRSFLRIQDVESGWSRDDHIRDCHLPLYHGHRDAIPHHLLQQRRVRPLGPQQSVTVDVSKWIQDLPQLLTRLGDSMNREINAESIRALEEQINAESIRALEEQVKGHEKAIIKLKRARNSLLNVSTLPPEVLGKVFRWNITLENPFDGLEEEPHNFLFVCRHWYEVASRTPERWAFWGNNFGHWEERYLRSSVEIPLDLVLDGITYLYGSLGKPQRMMLEERAARDTIRRVHLPSANSLFTTRVDRRVSRLLRGEMSPRAQ